MLDPERETLVTADVLARLKRKSTPIYVAGPYSGASLTEVTHNIGRAEALGKLLIDVAPYRPVLVPHSLGARSIYGEVFDNGSTSKSRTTALTQGVAWAYEIARSEGTIAVRLRDGSRSFSDGVQRELEHAREVNPDVEVIVGTWADWNEAAREYKRRGEGPA